MAELDINVDEEIIKGVSRLAIKYFGDDDEASQRRVVESALAMHILWSRLVKESQMDTDEAVSRWEFAEAPVTEENGKIPYAIGYLGGEKHGSSGRSHE